MGPPTDRDRMEQLEARLAAARNSGGEHVPHQEEHYSQAQMGWRMVTELVAGLAIGFGVGYGLDMLFGTLPILLVLFTLLGFAAGVRVMLRTAKEVQAGRSAERDDDIPRTGP